MSVIDAYEDFAGGAVELAACAVKCGAGLGWASVDPDRTNERLVRYYVTDGVIDRPDRVGRDAVYQFRHLVQLLNARRLSEKGVALSVIGDYNRRAKTQDLRAGLERPAPTEAELLVQLFKPAAEAISAQDIVANLKAQTASQNIQQGAMQFSRMSAQRPPTPAPDVAAEVTRLREDFAQGMKMIEKLCAELDSLTDAVRQVVEANAVQLKEMSSQIEKLAAGSAVQKVNERRKAARAAVGRRSAKEKSAK